MKRLTIIVIIVVVLLMLATSTVAGAYALAAIGPFNPGSPMFALQGAAEQFWLNTTTTKERRADDALILLARRTNDLAALTGTDAEVTALQHLDQMLDLTLAEVAALTPASYPLRRSQLVEDVALIKTVIKNLQTAPVDHAGLVEAFTAKIEALDHVLQSQTATPKDLLGFSANPPTGADNASPAVEQGVETPIPGLIPFPGDSATAMHQFFPLEGGHSGLDCTKCHRADQYAGLVQTCSVCHEANKPENHFDGPCDACHLIASWTPASFDHALANAIDCQSCHSDDAPAGHYRGQCSACHTTTGWTPATFDHAIAGATDCQSCHSRPAGHYSGQCSACHTTTGWTPAIFDHTIAGATDCQSCHNRPAGHYGGQCSACHNTNAWTPASFNHSAAGATDCQSCHSRPAGHYSGQCSACHSTSTWSGARIDHSQPGLDCRSCHSGHTTEQCSNCHSYPSWDDAEGEDHEGGNGGGKDDGDDD